MIQRRVLMLGDAGGAVDFTVGIVTLQYVSYNAYRLCVRMCADVFCAAVFCSPWCSLSLSHTHPLLSLT